MKETRQEKAYNWLVRKIKERSYLPGMPLKEELIARQIETSATPVREALRRLEREGWVENIPYRGCFLKTYSFEQFREVSMLRESLESAAVPLILAKVTEEDWQILDGNLRDSEILVIDFELDEEPEADLNQRAFELDREFHVALIAASHSEKLIAMSEVWNFQLQTFAFQNFRAPDFGECKMGGKPQFHWILQQHRAICTALRMRWENAAQELMRAHISHAERGYVKEKMVNGGQV